MKTQCTVEQLEFHALGRRSVTGRFDGGRISSDGGGVLLREVDLRTGVTARVSRCFVDYRNRASIEHGVDELVAQRIYAIALGYEDLNDHDALRDDALFSVLVGKADVTGDKRVRERDRGHALASASTLDRLELGEPGRRAVATNASSRATRNSMSCWSSCLWSRIAGRRGRSGSTSMRPMTRCTVTRRADSSMGTTGATVTCRCISSVASTWCARGCAPRTGMPRRVASRNSSASWGNCAVTGRPNTRIGIRGDSGFCRESILRWCEDNGIDHVPGLARNERLVRAIGAQMRQAQAAHRHTGIDRTPARRRGRRTPAVRNPGQCKAARRYRDFTCRTRKSWSRSRRVVGKAEYLTKGENPRFVVTSLSTRRAAAKRLYEKPYCARGDMENRIKHRLAPAGAESSSLPCSPTAPAGKRCARTSCACTSPPSPMC